jgi:hypothetical protein
MFVTTTTGRWNAFLTHTHQLLAPIMGAVHAPGQAQPPLPAQAPALWPGDVEFFQEARNARPRVEQQSISDSDSVSAWQITGWDEATVWDHDSFILPARFVRINPPEILWSNLGEPRKYLNRYRYLSASKRRRR